MIGANLEAIAAGKRIEQARLVRLSEVSSALPKTQIGHK